MVAFPLIKLFTLLVKQISKPIARRIKVQAATSPRLRPIVMAPAQWYHIYDTRVKMRVMGLGKPKDVKPLNEEMAVEQGAELISEMFLFGIGILVVAIEYKRSSASSEEKEKKLNDTLNSLQNQVQDLGIMLETQDAQIRELNRSIASFQTASKKK